MALTKERDRRRGGKEMNQYFDNRETRHPNERQEEYNRRLAEMVRRGYECSKRIRNFLDERNLKPSDITVIADLEKLPVISREELIEWESKEPPYGGFSDTGIKTDRIFTSPGPVYEPHLTEKELLWARGYHAAGFGEGDIALNTFSYHMVAAGLTFHEGLRAVGATVVPAGTATTENQVQLINHLGVTAYAGTPSFLKAIINKAEELGFDITKDFKLKKASFVAEPLEKSLREVFEKEYGIDTYQMYGATEVGDIAYECSDKHGWHICEDAIVEIVDPATGACVTPGMLGEVVVTRLNPLFFLFRFGTGDLSRIIESDCPCGRTSYRLDGIAGRVGEAVKVRGMFVAPSQLKKIREYFNDISYQIVITRESHRDYVTAMIESPVDDQDLIERFTKTFKDLCTIRLDKCEIAKPGNIDKKDRLIVDKRDGK
jgi:phenylacetate-CoA ligase